MTAAAAEGGRADPGGPRRGGLGGPGPTAPHGRAALAILLTAAPPSAAVETAWRLALASAERGYGAGIFMMDDGVHAAAALAERLRQVAASGASGAPAGAAFGASGAPAGAAGVDAAGSAGRGMPIALVRCAQDARRRRAAPGEGVVEGSQADWARLVAEAGRVIHLA